MIACAFRQFGQKTLKNRILLKTPWPPGHWARWSWRGGSRFWHSMGSYPHRTACPRRQMREHPCFETPPPHPLPFGHCQHRKHPYLKYIKKLSLSLSLSLSPSLSKLVLFESRGTYFTCPNEFFWEYPLLTNQLTRQFLTLSLSLPFSLSLFVTNCFTSIATSKIVHVLHTRHIIPLQLYK